MKRQKICKFCILERNFFLAGITRVTFWAIWRLSVNFKAIALQANQVSDDWQVLVSRRNIGGEKVAVWCPTWAVEGKYLTRTMKSHFRWLCHRSKLVQLILFGTRLICPLCHLLQVNGLSTLFFFYLFHFSKPRSPVFLIFRRLWRRGLSARFGHRIFFCESRPLHATTCRISAHFVQLMGRCHFSKSAILPCGHLSVESVKSIKQPKADILIGTKYAPVSAPNKIETLICMYANSTGKLWNEFI